MRSRRSLFYNETPVFIGVIGLHVLGGVCCMLGLLGLARFAQSLCAMLPIIPTTSRAIAAVRACTMAARTRVTLNIYKGGVKVREFLQFGWAEASNLDRLLLEGNGNGGDDTGAVHGVVEVELS